MVTTIQIDERTKALLDKIKIHQRQSYNEIIEKMAESNIKSSKKDIMRFAGIWSHKSDEEIEGMKKSIRELRKKATKEMLRSYDLPGF